MFPKLQLGSNVVLSPCLLVNSYFGKSASAVSMESGWCHSPCGFRTIVLSDHLKAGTSHLVQSHLTIKLSFLFKNLIAFWVTQAWAKPIQYIPSALTTLNIRGNT